MSLATARLRREIAMMEKAPTPLIRAKPSESNILHFHFVVEGPPDSPYEGGYYHGKLIFPSEYPLKPPAVMMCTPSGRFTPNMRICFSMSDYHPESWNPVWSVATILLGLQSFMVDREVTAGGIDAPDAEKRRCAAASLEYNVKNDKDFVKMFPELVALHESKKAGGAGAAAAGAAAAPVAAVGGAASGGAGAGAAAAGGK